MATLTTGNGNNISYMKRVSKSPLAVRLEKIASNKDTYDH